MIKLRAKITILIQKNNIINANYAYKNSRKQLYYDGHQEKNYVVIVNNKQMAQIHINKNSQFGRKQRFKPLQKLEEKYLQDDDSIDSQDLSVNYGPLKYEEAEQNPGDEISSEEEYNNSPTKVMKSLSK